MNDYETFFAQVSPDWSPFTATDQEIEAWKAAGQPTDLPHALSVEIPQVYAPEGDE